MSGGKLALGEVQFVKAEIKRNNITLPQTLINSASNQTISNKAKLNKEKANTARGEKKSEFYVVNNGLLLLHPKKAITLPGVKKSIEPIPPSAVNYHVIKRTKSNSTEPSNVVKSIEKHLKRRSLFTRFWKKFGTARKHSLENEGGERRIGIIYHGRITSINKMTNLGERKVKLLPSSNQIKNHSLTSKDQKYKEVIDNSTSSLSVHGITDQTQRVQSAKRGNIENPLFDSDQKESMKAARKKQRRRKDRRAFKRMRESQGKQINPIRRIQNINNYFEKALSFHEYPRFAITPFQGHEYPRFPISQSALSTYPRFSLSPQEHQILHRFPIHPALLTIYPRYPFANPTAEFPRFEKGLKRFTEYPKFEEIKPVDIEDYPRFPEPKPIPEIKDIGDGNKRSKSKRGVMPVRRSAINRLYYQNFYYHDDDDDDDDDDGDGDGDGNDDNRNGYNDESYDHVRDTEWYMGQRTPFIAPIRPISHLHSPPAIPEIADIPFLAEIPSLHGIHSIKPISSIKLIPSSDMTGSSRTLPTGTKNIAKIQSNNVSIKDLSKDGNTHDENEIISPND